MAYMYMYDEGVYAQRSKQSIAVLDKSQMRRSMRVMSASCLWPVCPALAARSTSFPNLAQLATW